MVEQNPPLWDSINYLVVPPMGTHSYSFQVVIFFLLKWSTMDLINLTAIQYIWSEVLCRCRWFHFPNAFDLSIVYGISSFTDLQLLSSYRLSEGKHLLGLKMDGDQWAHCIIKNSTDKRKGYRSCKTNICAFITSVDVRGSRTNNRKSRFELIANCRSLKCVRRFQDAMAKTYQLKRAEVPLIELY